MLPIKPSRAIFHFCRSAVKPADPAPSWKRLKWQGRFLCGGDIVTGHSSLTGSLVHISATNILRMRKCALVAATGLVVAASALGKPYWRSSLAGAERSLTGIWGPPKTGFSHENDSKLSNTRLGTSAVTTLELVRGCNSTKNCTAGPAE